MASEGEQTGMQQGTGRKPKTAFVLSGGAALGASQVGMLRALLERDIQPDLIVGTSIGAWNGLWLATHNSLADLEKLEQIWRGITLLEVFGANPMHLVINITGKRPYLVAEEGMERVYRRAAILGDFSARDMTFEGMPVPLKITATDIMRGVSKVFEHGPIKPALFASSAIPGLFPPVMIDGEQYVDGGLLDNGGVSVAVEAGAEIIYVLSLTYGGARATPIVTMSDLLERSFHLVASRHVHAAVERFKDLAHFVVIEDHHAAKMSSLDFRHPGELIASGYRAAAAVLDQAAAEVVAHTLHVQATHDRQIPPGQAGKQRRMAAPTHDLWEQPALQATLRALAWMDLTLARQRHPVAVPAKPRPVLAS